MEPKLCPICKQTHRGDYRAWSEYFQKWMTPNEFITAVVTAPKLSNL
jgi:hypothetical protein